MGSLKPREVKWFLTVPAACVKPLISSSCSWYTLGLQLPALSKSSPLQNSLCCGDLNEMPSVSLCRAFPRHWWPSPFSPSLLSGTFLRLEAPCIPQSLSLMIATKTAVFLFCLILYTKDFAGSSLFTSGVTLGQVHYLLSSCLHNGDWQQGLPCMGGRKFHWGGAQGARHWIHHEHLTDTDEFFYFMIIFFIKVSLT